MTSHDDGGPDPRLDDLPSLQTFGARLATHESARRARGPWGRLSAAVLAAVGGAGVFAAGAAIALTAATGSPVPDFARGDTTTVFPDPGSTRIVTGRAADPYGGAPWAVRVGRADDGLVCVGVGQVDAGRLGVVGIDRTFRDLPPTGNDECGPAPGSRSPLVQLRGFAGPRADRPSGATTVLHGSGGAGLRNVRVRVAGRPSRSVPVGDAGTFVLAVRGWPEGTSPVVDLTWSGGAHRSVTLGPTRALPDPDGLVAWQAGRLFRPGAGCAAVAVMRVETDTSRRACATLHGPSARLSDLAAVPRAGTGPRRVLVVRTRPGQRATVRLRGAPVRTARVELAGPTRRVRFTSVARARSGRGRTVAGSILQAGRGPAGTVAVLGPGIRARDLRVDLVGRGARTDVPVMEALGR